MTGLSDAFKDEMTRGAVVDLTDNDFATITAPPHAGPWMRHSVAFYGGSSKRAKIAHSALYLVFWVGLMCAILVLMHMEEVPPLEGIVATAVLAIGSMWHFRLAKITCLRAAGYTYDWKTHTAHRIVRTADLKE